MAFGLENESTGTEDVVVVVEAEAGADAEQVQEDVRAAIAHQSDCIGAHGLRRAADVADQDLERQDLPHPLQGEVPGRDARTVAADRHPDGA